MAVVDICFQSPYAGAPSRPSGLWARYRMPVTLQCVHGRTGTQFNATGYASLSRDSVYKYTRSSVFVTPIHPPTARYASTGSN